MKKLPRQNLGIKIFPETTNLEGNMSTIVGFKV